VFRAVLELARLYQRSSYDASYRELAKRREIPFATDAATGSLNVATYVVMPSRRRAATTSRVTKLPNARKVKIFVDGQPFKRFHRVAPDTIQIDCGIDSHYYRIVTGYHHKVDSAETQPESAPRGAASSKKNETFASASLNGASASSFLASTLVLLR
jgi:hypothetical protein